MENNNKQVVIVVPRYQLELSESDQQSLAHLRRFLGTYPIVFLSPDNLAIPDAEFPVITFPARFFTGRQSYAELLLSTRFYEAFSDYEYMLIYQLDVLVFSDQLTAWCQKGYDYIGAPWIKSQMIREYNYPDAVGNGGFSLRNIDAALTTLKMAHWSWYKVIGALLQYGLNMRNWRGIKPLGKGLKAIWSQSAPHRSFLTEDRWWSLEAPKINKEFKIPSVDIGLQFAFEIGPRYCFERTNHTLPFGCHAWEKYDKEFWSPYLLKK